jgi:hypothetical protein
VKVIPLRVKLQNNIENKLNLAKLCVGPKILGTNRVSLNGDGNETELVAGESCAMCIWLFPKNFVSLGVT